jgi:hypothetical protein
VFVVLTLAHVAVLIFEVIVATSKKINIVCDMRSYSLVFIRTYVSKDMMPPKSRYRLINFLYLCIVSYGV